MHKYPQTNHPMYLQIAKKPSNCLRSPYQCTIHEARRIDPYCQSMLLQIIPDSIVLTFLLLKYEEFIVVASSISTTWLVHIAELIYLIYLFSGCTLEWKKTCHTYVVCFFETSTLASFMFYAAFRCKMSKCCRHRIIQWYLKPQDIY